MNHIKVLDCTLRDGGYCNKWNFGKTNIQKIIRNLEDSGVNIIECGFLTNKVEYNENVTKFTSICQIGKILPKKQPDVLYVCMMNYGEYDVDSLPRYDGKSADGIRIAFHKKDVEGAFEIAKKIKDKGYKVFIQAMVSLNYSDEEFLNLIKKANELEPYAFYIVDSFGVMKKKDLIRLFYMVEHNLKDEINIGYHSHNNMQLSFSNAQALVDIRTRRKLIIDSCVFGRGRGAGNLNTELFVDYLNDNIGSKYELKPLLNIIDETLNNFYKENYWGYSLENYLSAMHNCHPNYASYLEEKQTLTVENINSIFEMIDDSKKTNYDKDYIEKLYLDYMKLGEANANHWESFRKFLSNKKVLVIALGKSVDDEKDVIISKSQEKDVITISVNSKCSWVKSNFLFLSNLRRYRELGCDESNKIIATSNIPIDAYLKVKYDNLLNDRDSVNDNSGLMLIKLLLKTDVKEVMLAGFDGYSQNVKDNYCAHQIAPNYYNSDYKIKNDDMSAVLSEFSKSVKISFLTKQRFLHI